MGRRSIAMLGNEERDSDRGLSRRDISAQEINTLFKSVFPPSPLPPSSL